MVAHIKTIAFQGVDAVPIDVQVHLAPGQNAFTVVGLPDKSVAESRERVRAALSAIGLALPYDRITINLSPADLPKEGSHYDVPIALGLLVAMGAVEQGALSPYYVMGELGLDGDALTRFGEADAQGQKLFDAIIDDGQMTARGFNRVLRVARTLAGLADRARPNEADIASALMWRGRMPSLEKNA